MGWLRTLWTGNFPLPQSFWRYGIGYSLVLNAVATAIALVIIVQGGSDGLAAAFYALPIPYDAVALIGVWRSAARWTGEAQWASSARLAITLWMAAMVAL